MLSRIATRTRRVVHEWGPLVLLIIACLIVLATVRPGLFGA
jgi:hypothetical protein